MNKEQKKQVLEILDYWKTIEFLEQNDLPKVSNNRAEEKSNVTKKEVKMEFIKEASLEPDLQSLIEDETGYLPECSERIGFIYGKITRNTYAERIERFMEEKPESPESPHPKSSAFGWFSFSTDSKGVYQKKSFQLSPLLWALYIWNGNNATVNHDFHLKTEEYDEMIAMIDEELEEKNINEFLQKLYQDIEEKYVNSEFSDSKSKDTGIIVYKRYADENVKSQEETEDQNLSDLGKSFFIKDLELLYDKVNNDKFGDSSDYEKKVIDYILSAYRKSKEINPENRTIISPGEDADNMRVFFETALNISKAPVGKWPAKFMPALMQQVAVNLAIQKEEAEIPIFSVNGPPGTGKTTLLKEIVANNIVERAKLLAKYDEPDNAFVKKSFKEGPLEDKGHAYFKYAPNYYVLEDDEINRYGMLVASCNNAAVENITVDLPKAKDILNSLSPKDESKEIKAGLQEVYNLFNIEESNDIEMINVKKYKKQYKVNDIYFTRYAEALLGGSDDYWGLVSAPFGKKSNIRKYSIAVLRRFLEEYNNPDSRDYHKKEYKKAVKLLKDQVQVVERLAKEISNFIEYSSSTLGLFNMNLSVSKDEVEHKIRHLDSELFDKGKKIIELEEIPWFKKILGLRGSSSTRNEMIAELKMKVKNLKQEKLEQENIKEKIQKYEEYTELESNFSKGENKLSIINQSFIDAYLSDDEELSTKAQVTNPWFTPKYNREREKLFLYACKVHKEFCLSSKGVMHNIINLLIAWNMYDECGKRMKLIDRDAAMPSFLQTVFLLTPVISTTFASAQTFLKDIKKSGALGTLIVDEAGQAQPQMAIGALFRCRKAIIVGDPKQIEPVVTAEVDMIKQLMSTDLLSAYKDKKLSVQSCADYINPYGTFLGEEEEKEWVGCPLVVHRRCIDPMYSISNVLSYDGTMKQQTDKPKQEKCETFILEKSAWIQVPGSEKGQKDHFVEAQGKVVIKLLERKIEKTVNKIPLYIITPFTSVKYGMIKMLRESDLYREDNRIKEWVENDNIGTVHTFQGKGTDEVIFLLGCDKHSINAANWVNKNIVNVAATRAKFRFYVIGDKEVWTCKPVKIARELINYEITEKQLEALLFNLEIEN